MKINNINIDDVSMKKFFKILRLEILKTIKEHPNHRIYAKIDMDIKNETDVNVKIYIDETKLVLDR